MITTKSDKELAFLHDLFVATDWGQRFAALIDENVTLPEKGRILYLEPGTGGHLLALQEHSGDKLSFVCLEENEEYLEIARSKATAANAGIEFQRGRVDELPFPDNAFDLAIGEGSLIAPQRVPKMLAEMVRVVRPGKTVVLVLPTASSFGEFFSIYWEVLHNCGIEEKSNVQNLISELPTVAEIDHLAENAGLEDVVTVSRIEEFRYDSGEQFLNSPLVADFLMKRWTSFLSEHRRSQVAKEIPRVVNADRQQADFMFSVKATLLRGRKGQSH